MKRDFAALADTTFDIAVIGGGIIGAGIARDAALRGLKTVLVEKEDFGAGTTSRSTRLIHGGLRYLEHFDFGLVRADMREREILLKIAPHLVKPLSFLIPLVKPADRLVMALGTLVYDILSYDKSLPGRKYYSFRETMQMEPNLKLPDLKGSYRYSDCQAWYAERLCLENALAAAGSGAVILNHSRVTGLIKTDNVITGVKINDTITNRDYDIRARMVVNAAGHWMDEIAFMALSRKQPLLRRTKGVHLFIPRVSNHALVLFAKSDGRLWFVIPWEKYSLLGTTDTDYTGDPEAVAADSRDVEYIISEARRAFPGVKVEDIFFTHAGLRSLPFTGDKRPSNVSRAHIILDHKKTDAIDGFISVLGGKITGYRGIGQEITDLVCRKLGITAACRTAVTPLPGGAPISDKLLAAYAKESGLIPETITHLISLYGSRCVEVLDLAQNDSRGRQSLCAHSPDILAQVWHAVKDESALSLSDFIFRRGSVGLASCQGTDAATAIAGEMARLLSWSPTEQQRQVDEYHHTASLGLRFHENPPPGS